MKFNLKTLLVLSILTIGLCCCQHEGNQNEPKFTIKDEVTTIDNTLSGTVFDIITYPDYYMYGVKYIDDNNVIRETYIYEDKLKNTTTISL
tara:strand:+ start:1104 stop:1376 length:273 start_codon:yes stop_codon:yes gene_type:complete